MLGVTLLFQCSSTMALHAQKRVGIEDALDYILDGNESDVGNESCFDDDDDGCDDDGIQTYSSLKHCHTFLDTESADIENDDIESESMTENAPEDPASPAKKHIYRWRKRDIPLVTSSFHQRQEDITELLSPIQYFKQFWTDELNGLIVDQTNLYSVGKTGNSVNTNRAEIEQFIGMHLRMGIVNLPSYKLYWSQDTRYPPISDVMPLKRFQKLKASIHFVDNASLDKSTKDKLFKIRPVVELVRQQCLKIIPEECHSVDEQIIPTKTKYSGIRQYNPKKPKKWGFKNLVRAGSSGIMYDFFIYTGKNEEFDTIPEFCNLQKSAQIVASLCKHLPSHAKHKLFFDNWFTTLDLLIFLKRRGILACGTIRANRLQGCPLATNNEMKKSGRGALDFRSDMNTGIIIAKWHDNSSVHVASNFLGTEPLGAVERWCPVEKRRKNIQCPKLILSYNKGMGGVDLADMLISLYRIPIKTRRWYLYIFWHLVDIAKVNAWLLYRRHCDALSIPKRQRMSLLSFIASIAEAMINANKVQPVAATPKPGRPKKRSSCGEGDAKSPKVGRKATVALPCKETQYDQISHWPQPAKERRGRCRHCKDGYSTIYCSKCKICLCLRDGRNCFVEYHNK